MGLHDIEQWTPENWTDPEKRCRMEEDIQNARRWTWVVISVSMAAVLVIAMLALLSAIKLERSDETTAGHVRHPGPGVQSQVDEGR